MRNNQRQTKLDEAGSGEAIRAHGNAYLIDAKKPSRLAGFLTFRQRVGMLFLFEWHLFDRP